MIGSIPTGKRASWKNQRSHARNLQRQHGQRSEAEARQKAWNRLTDREQLAALDARLGKGVGAARQRFRIKNSIASEKAL